MIEIQNVSKIYETKKQQVIGVDQVTLTINKGDILESLVIQVQEKVRYYAVSIYWNARQLEKF